MTKRSFLLRKIHQVGKKFGCELINAADPAEVFSVLLKYRANKASIPRREQAFVHFVLQHFADSKAQLFQDLFALFSLDERRAGYFVEFGATNGIELSNTFLLERNYGWDGILAEPAHCWHKELGVNRSCKIDARCVWKKSGEVLMFNEVSDRELSTINQFSNGDGHSASRKNGTLYSVETVSLNDLLAEHGAPDCIDYLSIDTEGSEFEILQAFDFQRYDVKVITVEHAYTANKAMIHALLDSQGFARVFEGFSHWDDWYISRSLLQEQRR